MHWADLDGAAAKTAPVGSRAAQEGRGSRPWGSCGCHCLPGPSLGRRVGNTFSGFTAVWKPKPRALCRVMKQLHLLSRSSAASATRENTSHHAFPWREGAKKPQNNHKAKKISRLLFIYWPPSSFCRSVRLF